MSLTITCGLCRPPLTLGRYEDFWQGQAVLDEHVDEHTALIPLSAIAGSPNSEEADRG